MPENTSEIEQLKKENEKLKQENASYKVNGAVGLYYELNRLVNETINYTRGMSIKSMLGTSDGGGSDAKDKTFERTMVLIKNAKEHVLDMEEIKNKLGLSGNESKDKEKVPFIETVATKRD